MRLPKQFDLNVFIYSKTAEKLNIKNEPDANQISNLMKLFLLLKEIQTRLSIRLGREVEIEINSAFRCKILNKKVGGSKTSQHLEGESADIYAVGVKLDELYNYIKALVKAKVIIVGQVIKEYGKNPETENDDWCHVSLGTKNEFLIKHPDKPYIKDLS